MRAFCLLEKHYLIACPGNSEELSPTSLSKSSSFKCKQIPSNGNVNRSLQSLYIPVNNLLICTMTFLSKYGSMSSPLTFLKGPGFHHRIDVLCKHPLEWRREIGLRLENVVCLDPGMIHLEALCFVCPNFQIRLPILGIYYGEFYYLLSLR